jgi:hypothetical protein
LASKDQAGLDGAVLFNPIAVPLKKIEQNIVGAVRRQQ